MTASYPLQYNDIINNHKHLTKIITYLLLLIYYFNKLINKILITSLFYRADNMDNSRAESEKIELTMSSHSGQGPPPPRTSKHRERPSKSPRRRREGKRSQPQPSLQETGYRRLPGQREQSAQTSTAIEPAEEGSPKRFATCYTLANQLWSL